MHSFVLSTCMLTREQQKNLRFVTINGKLLAFSNRLKCGTLTN